MALAPPSICSLPVSLPWARAMQWDQIRRVKVADTLVDLRTVTYRSIR